MGFSMLFRIALPKQESILVLQQIDCTLFKGTTAITSWLPFEQWASRTSLKAPPTYLPTTSPMLMYRKTTLVARILIRKPVLTNTAPTIEVILLPSLLHATAARGPGENKIS
ncbi:hypothetical protein SKAU_G00171830 [Synaphobranchus kaupii]|uniref:Uncharacterized protein n=1 Tax=Synaphobranchus kaupii TaxID=118154 RepID=A0A9Q1FKU2_SYNKA|nr:hypothetical protein SKAU_G00171830 [Synaphobranchus kaupii]